MNLTSEYRSLRLLMIGVPVNTHLLVARILVAAKAPFVFGFLMLCPSSSTMRRHLTEYSPDLRGIAATLFVPLGINSEHSVPYVVITTSYSAKSLGLFALRPFPWYMRTLKGFFLSTC